MQNSTNTIYKIDNSVCTGMLGANLKCNKYVCCYAPSRGRAQHGRKTSVNSQLLLSFYMGVHFQEPTVPK